MQRQFGRLALLGALVMLTACALVPGPESGARATQSTNDQQTWQLGGRFAAGQNSVTGDELRDPVAGRFVWQHQAEADVLWLIGPLGNTLAKIGMTPERVQWQDARGQRGEAANLSEMSEHFAGITLPDLPADAWLRGRWPARQVRESDAVGHAVKAMAGGWQFTYRYGPPAPADWPLAVEGNGPDGLWLRLVLTEWNGLSEPESNATP